jgi:hypothetical protein
MAEITRTTAKTYFNTGDTPTEAQFANVLDSVPFPASDAVFTTLSGTAWDGSFKSLTLTGNTALTFSSTKRSGVLLVKQDATGSRTLTINGASAAINSAANSTSVITFIYNDVISDYVFSIETVVVGVTGGLDTTAPTLLSAVVSNAAPSNLVLTFNETLDSASVPATTDFDIQVNGASRNRDLVTLSGAVITLHLVSPILNGDTITVSYLAGGTNKIQDVAGNDAAAFVNTAVTNNVSAADTTPPTIVSKNTTSATNIRIIFSEAVTANLLGWSFKKNGSTLGASAISGSGTTWNFTVGTMAGGDTLLVSYDSSTGNTIDASGNELVSFTDSAVTNNIVAPDADATAFLTATGITDTTQSNAINQLVLDLKAAGLWTNMKAVYPIVGGTAATHKYNLKNAADTDAAFRLSFLGTVTHDANGVTGNGTTGYADTFLNDTTHITGNPITIGSYSRTNGNTGFSMGANGSGGTYIADRNGLIGREHDTADATTAIANQQRLIVITRKSDSVVNHYKDGAQLVNAAPSASGRVNFKYFLMAMNNSGSATGFSDKNYCFFFIYDGGMTQTEVTAITNAVNTYQTTLGRNV